MRTIKFRVWETTSKQMLDIKSIIFNSDGTHSVRAANMKETPEEKLLRSVFSTKSSHIALQFTGLFDRNGKEVYEGDIIKRHCQDPTCPSEHVGEVIYRDEQTCFALRDYKRLEDNPILMWDKKRTSDRYRNHRKCIRK